MGSLKEMFVGAPGEPLVDRSRKAMRALGLAVFAGLNAVAAITGNLWYSVVASQGALFDVAGDIVGGDIIKSWRGRKSQTQAA